MRGVKVLAGLLCWLPAFASAVDYRASAEDYRDTIRRLQPGDRLLLAAGDYRNGLPLHGLAGRSGRPITIEAADPITRPRFVARAGANTISLVNVSHLTLRGLELDGRNLPVDAVKAEGHSRFANHITLENLYIHDYAASQQNVGISTKCPALGWVIRGNRIERVGTGIYLGDSDGSDPFVGGTVEFNEVDHTLGYNLQIKHQTSRATGTRRQTTVIRYNVFSKQDSEAYASARPNVLLGDVPASGPGSADRYLVYGNLFLSNPAEALLQAEGWAVIYDNVFINRHGDAVRIQPHNGVPRDMLMFANTIVAAGRGVRVLSGYATRYRQWVVGNVIAAKRPVAGGQQAYNVVLPYAETLPRLPPRGLTRHLLDAAQSRIVLPPDWLVIFARYPGWQRQSHPGARQNSATQRLWEVVRP